MSRSVHPLGPYLERLYGQVDFDARRAADPVAFAHRYTDPADQELAGLIAASLAYGRVAAIRRFLGVVFDHLDAHGGPAAFVSGFEPRRDGPAIEGWVYRFQQGDDFVRWFEALRDVLDGAPSFEARLRGRPLVDGLDHWVGLLRAAAERRRPGSLPNGTRSLFPRPSDGSACKRWFMFLRWMIRSDREGVDLGLWRTRQPTELVIPLDTHVLRLSGFLGLTDRKDGSLRTALEVTDALRAVDPADPVRFDFALAHLGISGACRGYRVAEACSGCALDHVCHAM